MLVKRIVRDPGDASCALLFYVDIRGNYCMAERECAMKADDPRLEESLKRLTERIQKINDMIVTVLKNHLVLEQFINEFLAVCGIKTKGQEF